MYKYIFRLYRQKCMQLVALCMYTIHETSPNSMHMFGLDLEFRLDSFTFGFVYSMCLFALCIMIVSRFSIRILTLDYMYVYMAGPSYGRFRYLWCAFKINLFHFVLWSAKYPYFYLNAPLHFIGGIENVIHYREKKKIQFLTSSNLSENTSKILKQVACEKIEEKKNSIRYIIMHRATCNKERGKSEKRKILEYRKKHKCQASIP